MIDLIKKYIESRIQLVKLELITVFSNVVSTLVKSFIVLIFSMFILLMLSFSLAFWLAELLDSKAFGFGVVGAIYVVLFIIYLISGRQILEKMMKDKIVSSAYDTEEEINQEV